MLVIPVENQKVYPLGYFVRKPGTMQYLAEELYTQSNYPEDFMIKEIIILNREEWLHFHQDFFADKAYLKGRGGTDSTTTTPELDEKYPAWTNEEYEQFCEGAYRKCVAIFEGIVEDRKLKGIAIERFTIVDPQGYSYARYVALSEFYKEVHEDRYVKLCEDIKSEIFWYWIMQQVEEECENAHRGNGERKD